MIETRTPTPASYRGTYKPEESRAYKLSRSGVDFFLDCPRCFYMDRRLGVKRPSTPPFNINSAVDKLLKTEFDTHRAEGIQHPIQAEYGIDAIPAPHEELDKWRENFHGIQVYHRPTNLLLFGAIDDLWVNSKGEYIVVDYKATAKNDPVTELGIEKWHDAYRRQIEFYQWLLRHKGYKVSNTGYWVYCTGDPNSPSFDKKIQFRVHLISYEGNDSWVEPAVMKAAECLRQATIPESATDCEYCKFIDARVRANKEAGHETTPLP